MKKFIPLLLTPLTLLILTTSPIHAEVRGDYSLGLGAFAPRDSKFKETFGSDFFIHGNIGIIDDSGWELRGNLGNYSNISHNPIDIGNNLRLNVTPLTASVIYNIGSIAQVFQPYIGGGAGAYFYNASDDTFGNLETGTKFGFHLLAGLKLNISPSFFFITEYSQDFVPKFFFNNAKNFDTASLTIGIGFYFPGLYEKPRNSQASSSGYRYSQEEETLLSDIQQLTTEIKEMKEKRKEFESEIDTYYDTNNDEDTSPENIKEFKRIKRAEKKVKELDTKITEAQHNLDTLKQQWQNQHYVDNQPVEQHVVYLRENYGYSPYHLSYHNGYYTRGGGQISYRYYNPQNYPSTPQLPKPTIEEKKQAIQQKQEHINEIKNR